MILFGECDAHVYFYFIAALFLEYFVFGTRFVR